MHLNKHLYISHLSKGPSAAFRKFDTKLRHFNVITTGDFADVESQEERRPTPTAEFKGSCVTEVCISNIIEYLL